jgi:hypothetical protein
VIGKFSGQRAEQIFTCAEGMTKLQDVSEMDRPTQLAGALIVCARADMQGKPEVGMKIVEESKMTPQELAQAAKEAYAATILVDRADALGSELAFKVAQVGGMTFEDSAKVLHELLQQTLQ